jgi:hypothetical protein
VLGLEIGLSERKITEYLKQMQDAEIILITKDEHIENKAITIEYIGSE